MPRSFLVGALAWSLVVCGMAAFYLLRPIDGMPVPMASPGAGISISRQSEQPSALLSEPPTQDLSPRLRAPASFTNESRREDLLREIAALQSGAAEAEYGRVTDLLVNCGDLELLSAVLREIPDRGQRENFLQRVAEKMAKTNPAGTAVWLRSLEIEGDRSESLRSLSREWAEQAPQQAADFALTLPAGDLRRESLAATVAVWLRKDPEAAVGWASRLEPQPDFDPVAAEIARSPACLKADLGQTLNWAESITNDDLRKQSVSIAVQVWAERDANSAREYLKACPVLTSFQRASLMEELSLQ